MFRRSIKHFFKVIVYIVNRQIQYISCISEEREAFQKKMADRKAERAAAERKKMASARANRNAFKDQLEANAGPA